VFSSLPDCTRWKTSCCGIDPSIIVIHAARNQRTSLSSGFGRRLNFSFADACAITALAPPGTMPLTAQPM